MGFYLKQIFDYMKKKLPTILGTLCIAAILAACCITDKNGDPCTANYILITLAVILGIGAKLTEKYGQVR